jgi:hypothetical protein
VPSPTDISVVIPVYNEAAVLPRALTSVFAQTVAPAEIIVVDDGSTDDSAAIARTFGERVRLVQQSNAGVSAARNRGIAECRSELVAFLDADDEWLPEFLENMLRLVHVHPDCSMYCARYTRRFADGADVPCVIRGLPDNSPRWSGVLPDYFRIASASDPPVCSSAVVVRRELLLAVGGFPAGIAVGEDLLTWARLAARRPVAFSSVPMARLWQPEDAVPGVIARATRVPQTPDVVGRALRELLPSVPTGQRRSLRAYTALWHKMRASCYARLGRPGRAIAEMCRAVAFAPFSGALYSGILRSFLRKQDT